MKADIIELAPEAYFRVHTPEGYCVDKLQCAQLAGMSKTRHNHYVPQWYQQGFLELGRNTLAYLDLTPPQKVLDDGRAITERAIFDAPTSRSFRQMDLYSTFFGTSVNDEIERRLFGDIDARGSKAVRAFAGSDVSDILPSYFTKKTAACAFVNARHCCNMSANVPERTRCPLALENNSAFFSSGISASESFLTS